ncbi:hypothetical protein U8607_10950 [Methylobacterium durans]|uniref:hypothetical protein n=1 Tax=Methylobacterium durans TaxID=2202825 RepID=UPI002AFF0316|nr:hypothetical protein [Methylobacterium durans]MEA1832597.1 hypothetical protein [Methylobacterium durans]
MPGPPFRSPRSEDLLAEACARLSLFEDLPGDTIHRLSACGFGRGFLSPSLRARLRKAGFQDLGHLARSSPDAITKVRKFGPIRVEAVRTFLLEEIARFLPGAREHHGPRATRDRRLARLREVPVARLPLAKDAIVALGLDGGTGADLAGRPRLALLRTGVVTSADLDRVVARLADCLGEGRAVPIPAAPASVESPAAEAERARAHRAALLAERDREWEEAAPARGRRRAGSP